MYLRCLTGDRPKDWVTWMPWVEYCYNTTYHGSIKATPFEVVYGWPPPLLLSYVHGTTKVDAVDQALKDRDELLKTVRRHLSQAQERMKWVYDLNHREEELEVGDWVYLKLQAYRQLSVQFRKNQKPSPRFYGPYQVVQKISKVAYKVALPSGSRIHLVFHISLLKRRVGPGVLLQSNLSTKVDDNKQKFFPQAILDRKQTKGKWKSLVHWQGCSPAAATWENMQEFAIRYPQFTLEDKGAVGGEEMLKTHKLTYSPLDNDTIRMTKLLAGRKPSPSQYNSSLHEFEASLIMADLPGYVKACLQMGKLAFLAILVSGGIVLQILACALYNNWWPMLTVITYVILPMPLLFFAGSDASSLFSESGSSWADATKFLTGASAIGSIAIPVILKHAGVIGWGALFFLCPFLRKRKKSWKDLRSSA
ncbi:hypothetical protein F0562_007971 [Nyssa sinensis]|uniref:Chromo domain-containing protein n=1 Tax=Nyssa sinensis TaxID=561372 RepID=A0A5J5A6P2_9ASTE|nr:hypothetical protein F0562_007971 [Nyssa sinensis]